MNPELKHLIRLQAIDLSIQDIRSRVDRFPGISKALDEKLHSAISGLETAKDGVKNNLAARKKMEIEVSSQENKISKYREQMLSVKTNDEYKAFQKEIEHAQTAIRKVEDDILNLMMEAEAGQNAVKDAEVRLKEDQRGVAEERSMLAAEHEKDLAALSQYVIERKGIEADVSADLLPRYERVRKARGGIAVGVARDYVCEPCQVRIRPQVFQEILKNDKIIACDACQRILYNPGNMDHPYEIG